MNEEVRIKNEETGAGRLVLAMCGGWSAARNTAVVRGHGFGATREAGGPENGEKAPIQGVEDQGPLGFVGPFNLKKFGVGASGGFVAGWMGKRFLTPSPTGDDLATGKSPEPAGRKARPTWGRRCGEKMKITKQSQLEKERIA